MHETELQIKSKLLESHRYRLLAWRRQASTNRILHEALTVVPDDTLQAFFRAIELGDDPHLNLHEPDIPVGLKVSIIVLPVFWTNHPCQNLGATCYANASLQVSLLPLIPSCTDILQVWFRDAVFRNGVYSCRPAAGEEVQFKVGHDLGRFSQYLVYSLDRARLYINYRLLSLLCKIMFRTPSILSNSLRVWSYALRSNKTRKSTGFILSSNPFWTSAKVLETFHVSPWHWIQEANVASASLPCGRSSTISSCCDIL